MIELEINKVLTQMRALSAELQPAGAARSAGTGRIDKLRPAAAAVDQQGQRAAGGRAEPDDTDFDGGAPVRASPK